MDVSATAKKARIGDDDADSVVPPSKPPLGIINAGMLEALKSNTINMQSHEVFEYLLGAHKTQSQINSLNMCI